MAERHMTRSMRTLLILAGVLVALIAAREIVVAASQSDSGESDENVTLLAVDESEIRRIEWTYEGTNSVLVREGDTWMSESEPDASVDQSDADALAEALTAAVVERTLADAEGSEGGSDAEDASGMGLDEPSLEIAVTLDDGEEVLLRIGSATTEGSSYYATSSQMEGRLVIDDEVPLAFSTSVKSLYVMESPPGASTVSSLAIEQEQGTLTIYYSATGFGELYSSEYTWAFDDGSGLQEADASEASTLANAINHITWTTCEDPSAEDLSLYGFDDPLLTATLTYEVEESDDGSADEDGSDGDTENAEEDEVGENSFETFTVVIGSQAEDGSYYAHIEGSQMVYTLSESKVETLLQASAETLRPDDVCLMDWDMVNSIDITLEGRTVSVSFTRTSEGEGDDLEVETTYYRDGEELDSQAVEALIDAIDALEAEGSVDAETGESVVDRGFDLSVVFHRTGASHTTMTLGFSAYDNSFYLVSFNDRETLLVNRNDVKDLEELAGALLA